MPVKGVTNEGREESYHQVEFEVREEHTAKGNNA